MRIGIKYIFLTAIVLMVCILPFRTIALSPSSVAVDIAPESPGPGENTTITLSSYAANLDGVNITWYVNGKKISSGIGQKSFSTTAGTAGSETTVRAVLALSDGDLEKKIVLRPATMTLLYEAIDAYVPPFYKGKALPIADGEIKVVALPELRNGKSVLSAGNLLYNWKQNYNNQASDSGYGKNYYIFTNDYLQNVDNVSVDVSSIDGASSASANMNIRAFTPQISFYKNDSALGTLWETALQDGHKIVGDEIIVAAPYNMAPKNISSSALDWKWYINGDLTDNTSDLGPNFLPLKVDAGASGSANIRLDLESKLNLLGTDSKQLNVEF